MIIGINDIKRYIMIHGGLNGITCSKNEILASYPYYTLLLCQPGILATSDSFLWLVEQYLSHGKLMVLFIQWKF